MSTVELHFIDGPLQGTRMMADESVIARNRTYRHLQPIGGPEQIVPNNTPLTRVSLVCAEYKYVPFALPRSYSGPSRFAMCLENGLN